MSHLLLFALFACSTDATVCKAAADPAWQDGRLVQVCEDGSFDQLDGNEQLSGTCGSGDDCALGECGLGEAADDCSPVQLTACRTADDVCRVDSDCGDGERCRIAGDSWVCWTYQECGWEG